MIQPILTFSTFHRKFLSLSVLSVSAHSSWHHLLHKKHWIQSAVGGSMNISWQNMQHIFVDLSFSFFFSRVLHFYTTFPVLQTLLARLFKYNFSTVPLSENTWGSQVLFSFCLIHDTFSSDRLDLFSLASYFV